MRYWILIFGFLLNLSLSYGQGSTHYAAWQKNLRFKSGFPLKPEKKDLKLPTWRKKVPTNRFKTRTFPSSFHAGNFNTESNLIPWKPAERKFTPALKQGIVGFRLGCGVHLGRVLSARALDLAAEKFSLSRGENNPESLSENENTAPFTDFWTALFCPENSQKFNPANLFTLKYEPVLRYENPNRIVFQKIRSYTVLRNTNTLVSVKCRIWLNRHK